MKAYSLLPAFWIIAMVLSTIELHAQWILFSQTPVSYGAVQALAVNGTNVFVAGISSGEVFLSTDNGVSWITVNAGLPSSPVTVLTIKESNIFAGTPVGPYLSTNNGTSWSPITNPPMYNRWVNAIAFNDSFTFAATSSGVFRSTNNGTSWTAVNNGLTNDYVRAFAVSGTNLLAGTSYGGIFRSTNNGASWYAIGLADLTINAVAMSVRTGRTAETNLFAATSGSWNSGGIYLSTNNGASWTAVTTHIVDEFGYIIPFNALAVLDTNVFAGSSGYDIGGIFRSVNNGNNWIWVGNGLPTTTNDINALALGPTDLFAAVSVRGVWKRPLSEILTGINDKPTETLACFVLHQNYPNPFNPRTYISFSLPSRSFVSLKVFDALGREVSILLSEELPAGNYSRQWNATGLPSGVYFYRLQAGSFSDTKKLVLLR